MGATAAGGTPPRSRPRATVTRTPDRLHAADNMKGRGDSGNVSPTRPARLQQQQKGGDPTQQGGVGVRRATPPRLRPGAKRRPPPPLPTSWTTADGRTGVRLPNSGRTTNISIGWQRAAWRARPVGRMLAAGHGGDGERSGLLGGVEGGTHPTRRLRPAPALPLVAPARRKATASSGEAGRAIEAATHPDVTNVGTNSVPVATQDGSNLLRQTNSAPSHWQQQSQVGQQELQPQRASRAKSEATLLAPRCESAGFMPLETAAVSPWQTSADWAWKPMDALGTSVVTPGDPI